MKNIYLMLWVLFTLLLIYYIAGFKVMVLGGLTLIIWFLWQIVEQLERRFIIKIEDERKKVRKMRK